MTTAAAPRVCLLRASSGAEDAYARALHAIGYEAVQVPVLSFTVAQPERLRSFLELPEAFGGLICTSPRAVQALTSAAREATLPPWRVKRTYAVGPATAEALAALGLSAETPLAGTAEALAEQIIQAPPGPLPLLFLCGNRRHEVLPAMLTAAGIAWQELQVYQTHVRTDVSLPEGPSPTWVVSFSPSGVPALQALLSEAPDARIAAIGPTTATAVKERGLAVSAVAKTPSPKGLVAALQAAGG
ncbi:MAG: uroporphyrinogen-III synthase [Bacteroidetes bacterium]|jgi:uroporphyrinogen-III synthase|nr:uroporphyrinogen-III synthase [Bacteroidota bacterium]